jgi:hypothetical protein
MRLLPRRRPSPALVVATIALIVALSGTAYAVRQIDGSLLKSRSVSGAKLKGNTLGGREINEGRLGTVPSARTASSVRTAKNAVNAQFATTASVARSADNAINAGNARNADTVGGFSAGAFQPRVRWALVASGGAGAAAHVPGSGVYVVDFGSTVSGQGVFVSPNGGNADPGATGAGSGGPTGTQVLVQTFNAAGAPHDEGFYVAVIG